MSTFAHRLGRAVRRRLVPRALILMYHRIDKLDLDPWRLAVRPDYFQEQLEVLSRDWRPVSLPQLVQDLQNGRVRDRSVAVTFDDGYLDNFLQAKPLLEKYLVPATFFITTKGEDCTSAFWWDELLSILLEAPRLPQRLTIPIGNEQVAFDLGPEATLTSDYRENYRRWTVDEGTSTRRGELYLSLWGRLRPLPHHRQQQVLAELRNRAEVPPRATAAVRMSARQIRELSAHPLFTVGAHTATHPALADHTLSVQRLEVGKNKAILEETTGKPVAFFAYPYGSYNSDSLAAMKDNHFAAAVTTQSGLITKSSPPFELGRYQVGDWGGRTFGAALDWWYGQV